MAQAKGTVDAQMDKGGPFGTEGYRSVAGLGVNGEKPEKKRGQRPRRTFRLSSFHPFRFLPLRFR